MTALIIGVLFSTNVFMFFAIVWVISKFFGEVDDLMQRVKRIEEEIWEDGPDQKVQG